MNELDKKVLDVFNFLLYSNKGYYSHNKRFEGLVFDVKGTKVLLQWFRKSKDDRKTNSPITFNQLSCASSIFPGYWNVSLPDESVSYRFYITVGDYGRQLIVPELSRTEEAKALDRIEFLVNDKENEELNSVLSALTLDKFDL